MDLPNVHHRENITKQNKTTKDRCVFTGTVYVPQKLEHAVQQRITQRCYHMVMNSDDQKYLEPLLADSHDTTRREELGELKHTTLGSRT